MTSIKCPKCGKENILNSAISCPKCGYDINGHFKNAQNDEESTNTVTEMENACENTKKAISGNISKVIVAVIITIVLLLIIGLSQAKEAQKYEEEYKITVAAQICSIYNFTNAVIANIESMSSLEWYLENTKQSQEEALKTYGLACQNVLEENHGVSDFTPMEYTGTDAFVGHLYDDYITMYDEYIAFCNLISNPYVPADDFLNEVYNHSDMISDMFEKINKKFSNDLEIKYAIKDVHYEIYYNNK